MLLDEDKIVIRSFKPTDKTSKEYIAEGIYISLFLGLILLCINYEYLKINVYKIDLYDICFVIATLLMYVIILDVLSIPLLIRYRVIYITRKGITIKLFFYQKEYTWEQIMTKKYEKNDGNIWNVKQRFNSSSEPIPNYSGCVYFSTKLFFSKRQGHKPTQYYYNHPFSCVCVFFLDNNYTWKKRYTSIPTNVVDETYFKEKMREWNIKIKDYDLS